MGKRHGGLDYSGRIISKTASVFITLLAILAFTLSVLAYRAVLGFENNLESSLQLFSTQQKVNQSTTTVNPFISQTIDDKRILIPNMLDLEEQYYSMYFPREKAILGDQLTRVLQQLINLVPLDHRYWLRLAAITSASENVKVIDDELAWVLNRSYTLVRWNNQLHVRLASICFHEFDRLANKSANICTRIVAKVMTIKQSHKLHRLKRDKDRLQSILQRFEVNKNSKD